MNKPFKHLKTIIIIAFALFFLLVSLIQFSDSKKFTYRERMESKAPGPDPYPSDWAWIQRTFPYWKADASAYREEMEKVKIMRSVATSFAKLKAVPIEFAGPINIGGRISDIEFNPNNPNIVYAGAATGGIFKSMDMGHTWTPIFDGQANLSIGDIAVDPVSSNIIYVGTGEANGGHNNFPGGGVYKSRNGGITWQLLGLEETVTIGRILIDPSNPQRIFLAAVGSYFSPNTERGVYRSDNGGITWDKKLFITDSTGAIDIIMDPNDPARLMVAMWERVRRYNISHLHGKTSGLYRTFDNGESWEYIDPAKGLPDPNQTNVGRIGLALSPTNPDIVYALYTNRSSYLGLYKTHDFGDQWFDADPDKEIGNGAGDFSWYFGQIRIHPTNPDIVYAMDVSFMRSTDGGETWPIKYGYGNSPDDFHVDHHALAFHPENPDYIIEGNDGGINISTDAGVTWEKVSELPVTQFYEINLDYQNPERLYGGTQDNGTMRTSTGALNDWEIIYGGDGFYVNVDPKDPNIIYAESQYGNLGKSTNGGRYFRSALSGINQDEPTNWSTPVIMDPNDQLVLYYGTDRIYRTTDGADSWTPISPDLTDNIAGTALGTVTTIAVSPVNSSIIWAGTDDSHVWISTDYGENWSDVSESLPYRWVTRIVPDPQHSSIAYVTFSGLKWVDPQPHVFRTENLGQSWKDISNNLPDAPVNAFAVNPLNTQILFVGTDLGAYYSTNLGQTWQYISPNLPMVSIYDMKIHPTANYLAIGTHARSMYKIDLSIFTGLATDDKQPVVKSLQLSQNYPNPFNASTKISYTLSQRTDIILTVYSNLGEHIKTLDQGVHDAGDYHINWDGTNKVGVTVSSGVYIYQLKFGNHIESRKMLFVK